MANRKYRASYIISDSEGWVVTISSTSLTAKSHKEASDRVLQGMAHQMFPGESISITTQRLGPKGGGKLRGVVHRNPAGK